MTVEQARVRLARSSNRDEWRCEGLAEVAGWKEEEVQDSRNWELMPSIGVNRASTAGLTELGKGQETKDVISKAAILNALCTGGSAGGSPVSTEVGRGSKQASQGR